MNEHINHEGSTMADERTPLIQVVQVRPATQRYPHRNLRRFCTALLTIVPAIVLFALVLSFFLPDQLDDDSDRLSHYLPWGKPWISSSWPKTQGLDYADLEEILRTTPDRKRAEEWSKYYTSGPHLAGKNLSQAIWTRERWQEYGISKAEIVAYDIYINYPLGHRLALLSKPKSKAADGSAPESWKVEFEARLEEDVLDDDPTTGLDNRIPTFHGYSASGNVTAPYVFVNYGSYQDFEDLKKANVSLAGKIALIKYGGVFRGLKVKRAQELGMVGAIMYSDPGDDGTVTDENGIDTYPSGPARNPSSVQRGSVQFLSK
jgi:N-acetylated-alpha-linked acidic dipeptidase